MEEKGLHEDTALHKLPSCEQTIRSIEILKSTASCCFSSFVSFLYCSYLFKAGFALVSRHKIRVFIVQAPVKSTVITYSAIHRNELTPNIVTQKH